MTHLYFTWKKVSNKNDQIFLSLYRRKNIQDSHLSDPVNILRLLVLPQDFAHGYHLEISSLSPESVILAIMPT